MKEDYRKLPVAEKLSNEEEVVWINPKHVPFAKSSLDIHMADIEDAEMRLARFASFIMKCFPETCADNGLIESALTPIPKMQEALKEAYGADIPAIWQ